jgi:hypothetical protein
MSALTDEELARARKRIRILWIAFYAAAIILPVVSYLILRR